MYLLREIEFDSVLDRVTEYNFKTLLAAFKYASGAVRRDDYTQVVFSVDAAYKRFQNGRKVEPVRLFMSKQRLIDVRPKFVQTKLL